MRKTLLGFFIVMALASKGQETITPAPLPSVPLSPPLDRVLRDYERAWQAHDAKQLSTLFTEDGFVLTNGRPPVRGRQAIRDAYSKAGGPLALRALAYATEGSVGYIIGAFGRDATNDSGKFILTLKKSGGRWLITADMDNTNRWPPAAAPTATTQR
jgi:ketosteroid isomerase-like protein